jgi:hypothetical protein
MIVERRYLLLPTGSCDFCEERRKHLNDLLLPRMCQFFFATFFWPNEISDSRNL